MAATLKLSCFLSAFVGLVLGGIQSKNISPHAYSLIQTTVVTLGKTTMYEGMPANAFDWSF